jgi:transposase InsO family protein
MAGAPARPGLPKKETTIRRILNQLEAMKTQSHCTWRQLSRHVPYATLMRWRQRRRRGLALYQRPGPKKSVPLDWAEFYPLLQSLNHGRMRSQSTTLLYQRFAASLSRRQLRSYVRDFRQQQLDTMKHIHWLWSGLAWSLDATEYGDDHWQIIPVQDLASRYRFAPLVTDRLDGRQIAHHLEQLFQQHGPPLFLKRDNGSPFNNQHIDQLLARYGVLPLNSPPACPRYNGAIEKSIGDLKRSLDRRLSRCSHVPTEMLATVEATVHQLNHRTRRCLKGRSACAVFHDAAQRLRWNRRQRQAIFRLLLRSFGQKLGIMTKGNHRAVAAAWRLTVESWLRCQGLISVRQKTKMCQPIYQLNWSHN